MGYNPWGRQESDTTKHAKKHYMNSRRFQTTMGEYQVFHSLSPLKQKFYSVFQVAQEAESLLRLRNWVWNSQTEVR